MTIADILDLARRPGGYLAPVGGLIDALQFAGLVTTIDVGDGFVIARAIQAPVKPRSRFDNLGAYRARQANGAVA